MKTVMLQDSYKQLYSIIQKTYPEEIRAYACDQWKVFLNPQNPMWEYLTVKPFTHRSGKNEAHVLAMIDKRMPKNGLVGFFAATSEETGSYILKEAASYLFKNKSILRVYGPIDGTIWANYRINSSEKLSFAGEPVNPGLHYASFEKAGFSVCNEYISGITSTRNARLFNRFKKPPVKEFPFVRVRSIKLDEYEKELDIIYNLGFKIFTPLSDYCTPFSYEEFLYLYSDKLKFLDPGHTLILEDNNKPIGALLSYPYKDTLIIKTIGVLPDYQGTGVYKFLVRAAHQKAIEDKMAYVVYALVRQGNKVSKMKRPGVKIIGHYHSMVLER